MLPRTVELTYENMVEACKIEPDPDSLPLAPSALARKMDANLLLELAAGRNERPEGEGAYKAGATKACATKAGATKAGATKACAIKAGATKAGATKAGHYKAASLAPVVDQPSFAFQSPPQVLSPFRARSQRERRVHMSAAIQALADSGL